MHPKIMLRPVGWVLSAVGIASVAISVMLSVPLKRPPLLNSIHDGAVAVSELARPPVTEFQARDGTTLAYRLYPARNGSTDRVAIVIHGSAGSSGDMHAVAQALADAGVTAVAVDIRGHGGSGTRGDIAYISQLEDDLDDLVALLRMSYPEARLSVVAHSSGGGFGLRIASEAEGKVFDRFVLLAPELGYSAPTSRPLEGTAHWANADVPRIIALGLMRRAGIDWAQSLPVVAFATAPTAKQVTWQYT